MQEQVRAFRRTSDELAAARGRAPTSAELATALGWTEEDVVATMAAAATRAPVSLERWAGDEDDAPPAPADHLAAVEPGYEIAEQLMSLGPALAGLTHTERTVLTLRFADDLRHHEIATRLGIPDAAVGRLLGSALDALRRAVAGRSDSALAVAPTTPPGDARPPAAPAEGHSEAAVAAVGRDARPARPG